MIAAITEFSSSVFESGSGELRTIDMGASRILLRGSARSIVAGEVIGPMRPQDEAALHEEFARLAEAHHASQEIDATDLDETARRFAETAAPDENEKSRGAGIWIVLAVLLIAIAAYGWRSWSRASFEADIRQAIAEVVRVRPQLQAYPITLDVDHSARQIRLNGLAPGSGDAEALRNAVASHTGDYTLSGDIAIVTSQQSAAQSVVDMRSELEKLAQQLEAQRATAREAAASQLQALIKLGSDIAALAQSVQGGQAETVALAKRLEEMSAGVQSRIGELQKQLDDPHIAALRFVQSQAVFFERDAILRDPDAASKTLDALANILRATNAGVRLVGFASESGSNAINQRVARERAQVVAEMLEKRGIVASNIVIALRGTSTQLDSSEDRAGHANRRVQFEMLFETEKPSP